MDLRSILMHLQCELVAERSLVNPLDISWLQYDVLLQLDREHEMLPSELSLVMGISRCLLYTSPSPRDLSTSRMPSSA